MIDATYIIKKPLITEKTTWESQRIVKKGRRAGEPVNRYSFHVAIEARKDEIKRAIQELYKVRVSGVATQIRKGRTFRTRQGVTNTGDWKKAVVLVHPEDRIDLF